MRRKCFFSLQEKVVVVVWTDTVVKSRTMIRGVRVRARAGALSLWQ